MSQQTPLTPQQLFALQGRVALITGGSTGIGLMQARALHDAGARVYVVNRREEKGENAVQTYGFAGHFSADVTKQDELEGVAKALEEKEGKLDILIANAGGPGPTHHGVDTSFPDHSKDPAPGGGLKKMDAASYKKEILTKNNVENWNDLFSLNTTHILLVAMTFLPLLAKGSEEGLQAKPRPYTSTFISTGSISGFVKQAQMHYAYNASKAAANHLTKLIGFELTQATTAKIRVNALAPGVFPSEMTAGGSDEKTNVSDLSDKLPTMALPAGRPGETEDMAQATQFLASCEFLHGQVVTVDGGFTLTEP